MLSHVEKLAIAVVVTITRNINGAHFCGRLLVFPIVNLAKRNAFMSPREVYRHGRSSGHHFGCRDGMLKAIC